MYIKKKYIYIYIYIYIVGSFTYNFKFFRTKPNDPNNWILNI
ncbi:MAG: hypothetical protein N7Q72_02850 [Spiroplasma sp. Tabriz.8]|nr:hypothetical protein [Spiroplasma sp. Tabriz.8]